MKKPGLLRFFTKFQKLRVRNAGVEETNNCKTNGNFAAFNIQNIPSANNVRNTLTASHWAWPHLVHEAHIENAFSRLYLKDLTYDVTDKKATQHHMFCEKQIHCPNTDFDLPSRVPLDRCGLFLLCSATFTDSSIQLKDSLDVSAIFSLACSQ